MFSFLTHPGEDNDGYRAEEGEQAGLVDDDEEMYDEGEARDDADEGDEEQEGRWEAADDRFHEKYEES